jgi:ketosteroid isomerase-like protein
MKYFLLLVVAAICLNSCNNHEAAPPSHEVMKARMDSLRNDLLQTDLAFSQLSEQKGRNAAFIAYAAEHATLLRPFSMPITGKDSIVNLLNAYPDSGYTLTWVPIKADVAHSGDLGYSYGTYSLVIKNIGKEEGTYCTIWKKDKNHSWKFVLDTGNEGLNNKDESADKTIKAEEKKEEKKEAKKK